MYLRSYSYGFHLGVAEIPEEVLQLFTQLNSGSVKQTDFASDIINAGLQGRINFNREFNLGGYETSIRRNQHYTKESSKKKQSYLDFSSEDNFNEVASSGGIKAEQLQLDTIEEMKDAFEEVLMDEDLKYAVSTIKELNEDFISDYGTDLIFALKKAVKGTPQAVKQLKTICEEFTVVSDCIQTILSSKQEVDILFA